MKNAIVTLCIGAEAEEMGRVAHPRMRNYAQRIAADFIVISQKGHPDGPHFNKFRVADLFGRFERLLFLDADILVSNRCADLFNLVPNGQLGVYFESEMYDRQYQIAQVQKALGQIVWQGGYFNSGVMVLSPNHREMLGLPFGKYIDDWFAEQTVLNYNAQRLDLPFFRLNKWHNYFACDLRDGKMKLAKYRLGAYLLHYAGPPEWKKHRFQQMQQDDTALREMDKKPGRKFANRFMQLMIEGVRIIK